MTGKIPEVDRKIGVMMAWRNGAKIQRCWRSEQGPWHSAPDECEWNWRDADYRIAPEPRKAREFVVIRCKLNGTLMVRDAENDKRFCRTPECEYMNVREVLPE